MNSRETFEEKMLWESPDGVIREGEKKINAMLGSIGDHMSMMDKDLNILWANRTAKKTFGDDIVGRKCYEVYHGRKEPCELHLCPALEAFQDGNVHDREVRVKGKDGKMINFHCDSPDRFPFLLTTVNQSKFMPKEKIILSIVNNQLLFK